MLQVPVEGISVSTHEHNCNNDAVCDWIEGSLLFSNLSTISKSDLVDTLYDNQIYRDKDFAYEYLTDIWSILSQRLEAIGSIPYKIGNKRLDITQSWKDCPAYSFCLVLSLTRWYSGWQQTWQKGFKEQGVLFEEVTQHALQSLLPNWGIVPITHALSDDHSFRKRVEKTAEILGESLGNLECILTGSENDGGLDLLCHYSCGDGRSEVPILLVQCASGDNWKKKLGEATPNYWRQLISFATTPQKAFSIPFAISDRNEFRSKSATLDGWLLDRPRILSAGKYKKDWIPQQLHKRLCSWVTPRLKTLPLDE